MSCTRAHEVEIDDLLLDAESPEARAFREHCETCVPCAAERDAALGLLAALGSRAASQVWHPDDELLLALRRDPEALPEAELARIRRHFRRCPPCRDAFLALRTLAVAARAGAPGRRGAEGGWIARALAALAPLRAPLGRLAAAGALVLVGAVVAVGVLQRLPGGPAGAPETGVRGDERGVVLRPASPEEGAMPAGPTVLRLAPGVPGRLAGHHAGAEVVVELLGAGRGKARIRDEARGREIELPLREEPGAGGARVRIPASWLGAGRYRIEVHAPAGGSPVYRLEVGGPPVRG